MIRAIRVWGLRAGPGLVLVILVWRLGTNPFLHGLGTIDGGSLAAAVALTALATVCSAWRWKIVAGALGAKISLPAAVAAYYRSMFLNLTLPGGIVGDVHRGVSHGRDVGDVGRAVRSVVWERFAGQVVQILLTLVVLLALPSPVHSFMPLAAIAIIPATVAIALVARAKCVVARSAFGRLRHAAAADIRRGLLTRGALPRIALASTLVLAGHTATFLLAARTAGVTASASRMIPLALLAIAAMVLPSAAGWGPREGMTAWAFGAAGLGAGRGVATAVVYGVMVFVASLPGAAVLVMAWFHRHRAPEQPKVVLRERPAHA